MRTYTVLITREHKTKPYGVGLGLDDTKMVTIWFATQTEQVATRQYLDTRP